MKRAVLALLFLLAVPASALAVEGFVVPDVSKATLTLSEKQFIKDQKPPAGIDIKTYKAANGWLFRSYGVGGAVFRYDISESGELPYAYRLIDKDGDGVFETKEELTGEMTVSEKGQKYFVDLGPEPGKEYRYSYEDAKAPGMREQVQMLMGYPIYIPAWVIARFKGP